MITFQFNWVLLVLGNKLRYLYIYVFFCKLSHVMFLDDSVTHQNRYAAD